MNFWPAVVFCLFLGTTGVAIAAPGRFRKPYLALFFAMLLFCGFSGWDRTWPFHSWHLWNGTQLPEETFYVIEVADARGHRLLCDSRVALPKQPTQFYEIGALFLQQKDPKKIQSLTQFLLRKANDRRRKLRRPAQAGWAFPNREFGPEWSREEMRRCGKFVEIIVTRKRGRMLDAGKKTALTTLRSKTFR